MQQGIGAIIIQEILKYAKQEEINTCIYRRTEDSLYLQFQPENTNQLQMVEEFIDRFDLIKIKLAHGDVLRINLLIGEERVCTVTLSSAGITDYEIDTTTGLLIRSPFSKITDLPFLDLPSPEYLSDYLQACKEFYSLGLTQYAPDPELYDSWKSIIFTTEANRKRFWLVHGDEYIGTAVLSTHLSRESLNSEMLSLYVTIRPEKWHFGYGKLAVSLLLEEAKREGIDLLLARINPNSEVQKALMKKFSASQCSQTDYLLYSFLQETVDYSRFS